MQKAGLSEISVDLFSSPFCASEKRNGEESLKIRMSTHLHHTKNTDELWPDLRPESQCSAKQSHHRPAIPNLAVFQTTVTPVEFNMLLKKDGSKCPSIWTAPNHQTSKINSNFSSLTKKIHKITQSSPSEASVMV